MEEKLEYLKTYQDYLLRYMKYSIDIDYNTIENISILYGIYKILLKGNITNKETEDLLNLYECIKREIPELIITPSSVTPKRALLLEDYVPENNQYNLEYDKW